MIGKDQPENKQLADRPSQRRLRVGRPRLAGARFTEEEWQSIKSAARDAGLTPTGYVAASAIAAAQRKRPPSYDPTEAMLGELVRARAQLIGLTHLGPQVETLLDRVDSAVMALMQRVA